MLSREEIKNHWHDHPFADLRDVCFQTGTNMPGVLLEFSRMWAVLDYLVTERFNLRIYEHLKDDLKANLVR